MVHYNYKRRKQASTRLHLGDLPTKEDTKHRFNKIKQQNSSLNSIQNQIKQQTGDEFFFNMQNCYKKKDKILRKANLNEDTIKKQILLCEFRINKIRKLLTIDNVNNVKKSSLNNNNKSKHIRFESDSESNDNKYEWKANEDDKGYLDELLKHRDELKQIYENFKNKKKCNK